MSSTIAYHTNNNQLSGFVTNSGYFVELYCDPEPTPFNGRLYYSRITYNDDQSLHFINTTYEVVCDDKYLLVGEITTSTCLLRSARTDPVWSATNATCGMSVL